VALLYEFICVVLLNMAGKESVGQKDLVVLHLIIVTQFDVY